MWVSQTRSKDKFSGRKPLYMGIKPNGRLSAAGRHLIKNMQSLRDALYDFDRNILKLGTSVYSAGLYLAVETKITRSSRMLAQMRGFPLQRVDLKGICVTPWGRPRLAYMKCRPHPLQKRH